MRILILALLVACSCFASATDVYLAASAAGAANGSSCANARAVSFFNSSANWGAGATQIGPGTTVHLCGTFTGTNNSSMLTFQGSGTSGNPVTVLFETGAVLTSPAWAGSPGGGAIYCSGKSWIVIDGGTNGIIKNTANGTGLAQAHDSTGVGSEGCSNIEIKNLTITDIYVRTANSSDSCACGSGIMVTDASNINVHNNTIDEAEYTILGNYNGGNSNWTFSSNVLSRTAGCLVVGDDNTSASLTNMTADSNECFDLYVWDSPADIFHCDGFHVWASQNNSSKVNHTYSNNYFHGDPGAHATGWIYTSADATGASSTNEIAFNNVFQCTNNVPSSMMQLGGGANGTNISPQVYNNTFIGTGTGIALDIGSRGTGAIIKNNLFTAVNTAIAVEDAASSIASSDYNEINCTGSLGQCLYDTGFYTYAAWKSAFGFEAHSIGPSSAPSLTSVWHTQSGSPGIGAGTDLSGLSITGLSSDKLGTARGATWDIGAYEFAGGSSAPTVTTSAASSVTATTATGNGNVTSDGGDTITGRGVCWSTSANPTTGGTCATSGGTTGAFTASMTSLSASTLYHYRAYATNSVGTSYGSDTTFTTSASATYTAGMGGKSGTGGKASIH